VPLGCLSDLCSKQQKTRNDVSIFAGCGGYLYLYIRMYRFITQLDEAEKVHYSQLLQGVNNVPDIYKTAFFDPQYHLNNINKQSEAMGVFLKSPSKDITFYMSNQAVIIMGYPS
jgi:hypothetical protein